MILRSLNLEEVLSVCSAVHLGGAVRVDCAPIVPDHRVLEGHPYGVLRAALPGICRGIGSMVGHPRRALLGRHHITSRVIVGAVLKHHRSVGVGCVQEDLVRGNRGQAPCEALAHGSLQAIGSHA
jgi:hypothetical protein